MAALGQIRPGAVVLDCPDPAALADFYATLLGWPPAEIRYEGHWATLTNPAGGLTIDFQRAGDYQPPTWPDPARPQMFHFDLAVDDLDAAQMHAVGIGARLIDAADTHPTWRVYADPAGHPFCLCAC
jgi:predicted enzyme related to lactoylglutathione lyase